MYKCARCLCALKHPWLFVPVHIKKIEMSLPGQEFDREGLYDYFIATQIGYIHVCCPKVHAPWWMRRSEPMMVHFPSFPLGKKHFPLIVGLKQQHQGYTRHFSAWTKYVVDFDLQRKSWRDCLNKLQQGVYCTLQSNYFSYFFFDCLTYLLVPAAKINNEQAKAHYLPRRERRRDSWKTEWYLEKHNAS